MKKFWEINGPTIEESTKTAIKQITKFAQKRKLRPVELTQWEEGSTEVTVAITFEDANDNNVVSIPDWINSNRSAHGQG